MGAVLHTLFKNHNLCRGNDRFVDVDKLSAEGVCVRDVWGFQFQEHVISYPAAWVFTVRALNRWSFGDPEGAVSEFQEAVKVDPEFVPASVALFCAAGECKRWMLREIMQNRTEEVRYIFL